ncbi:MAG: type I methionyl aminopeptidase [Gaiellales bacterium]
MSIKTPRELEGMRAAGRVVALTLAAMRERVEAGVSTRELDEVAARTFARHGARSAPQLVYDFPGVTCISINDEAVHGIPGDRRLEPGDVITLDVTAELDGFIADAAVTVGVDPLDDADRELIRAAERGLAAGLRAATAGAQVRAVGAAVERRVAQDGFAVLRPLTGHGVGRSIHEEPSVPNFDHPYATQRLTEGLVITIEPIVASGTQAVRTCSDGWTTVTENASRAAHAEHTIMITRGRPLVLTAA